MKCMKRFNSKAPKIKENVKEKNKLDQESIGEIHFSLYLDLDHLGGEKKNKKMMRMKEREN